MNSSLPKVLHELANKPMIEYVLDATCKAGIEQITVVIGHEKELVKKAVQSWNNRNHEINITFHNQDQQNGTGHAVITAKDLLKDSGDYLIILLGDVPLIRPETMESSYKEIVNQNAAMLVITTELDNPAGYGRIVHNELGEICCIREEKEASDEEKNIREINTGVFLFKSSILWKYIHFLDNNNAKKEYYLTDMVEILKNNNEKVITYLCSDYIQFQGINSPDQLNHLEKAIGITT